MNGYIVKATDSSAYIAYLISNNAHAIAWLDLPYPYFDKEYGVDLHILVKKRIDNKNIQVLSTIFTEHD